MMRGRATGSASVPRTGLPGPNSCPQHDGMPTTRSALAEPVAHHPGPFVSATPPGPFAICQRLGPMSPSFHHSPCCLASRSRNPEGSRTNEKARDLVMSDARASKLASSSLASSVQNTRSWRTANSITASRNCLDGSRMSIRILISNSSPLSKCSSMRFPSAAPHALIASDQLLEGASRADNSVSSGLRLPLHQFRLSNTSGGTSAGRPAQTEVIGSRGIATMSYCQIATPVTPGC